MIQGSIFGCFLVLFLAMLLLSRLEPYFSACETTSFLTSSLNPYSWINPRTRSRQLILACEQSWNSTLFTTVLHYFSIQTAREGIMINLLLNFNFTQSCLIQLNLFSTSLWITKVDLITTDGGNKVFSKHEWMDQSLCPLPRRAVFNIQMLVDWGCSFQYIDIISISICIIAISNYYI